MAPVSSQACCTGCRMPSSARPSAVVTRWPAASAAGVMHEVTARRPISTVQAPHAPSPQPSLGPVTPRSSRSTSSRLRPSPAVTSRSVPLTMIEKAIAARSSLRRGVRGGKARVRRASPAARTALPCAKTASARQSRPGFESAPYGGSHDRDRDHAPRRALCRAVGQRPALAAQARDGPGGGQGQQRLSLARQGARGGDPPAARGAQAQAHHLRPRAGQQHPGQDRGCGERVLRFDVRVHRHHHRHRGVAVRSGTSSGSTRRRGRCCSRSSTCRSCRS